MIKVSGMCSWILKLKLIIDFDQKLIKISTGTKWGLCIEYQKAIGLLHHWVADQTLQWDIILVAGCRHYNAQCNYLDNIFVSLN